MIFPWQNLKKWLKQVKHSYWLTTEFIFGIFGRIRSNYRLCVARIVHDGTDLMNAFKIAFRIF